MIAAELHFSRRPWGQQQVSQSKKSQNNDQELFLLQLFVTYGNRLANQIWASAMPGAEQLFPESSDEQRSKFIKDKYSRGRYRRVHALASSQSALDQVCLIVTDTSCTKEKDPQDPQNCMGLFFETSLHIRLDS